MAGLDAIDGTPVLDIKPYMLGFAPCGELREPDWSRNLMAGYWQGAANGNKSPPFSQLWACAPINLFWR